MTTETNLTINKTSSQHISITTSNTELLKQILPIPSTQLMHNRFDAEHSAATCKPGCNGKCSGGI